MPLQKIHKNMRFLCELTLPRLKLCLYVWTDEQTSGNQFIIKLTNLINTALYIFRLNLSATNYREANNT